MSETIKYVYAFGSGGAEGKGDQKQLLGGKGAGLAEMSRLGAPVPSGFTLSTGVCTHYHENGGNYPESLSLEVAAQLSRLEKLQGLKFGDPESPLLLSVRSGAPISMPGMMDTVLNLGLNDEVAARQIEKGVSPRFVRDAYRRLLTMYGDVVLGVPHGEFEGILAGARREQGVASDPELSAEALGKVIESFEALIERHTGKPFPQDPDEQLWGGIGAVFASWNIRRAREYRRLNGISEEMGTAVNVQTMVFGNRGEDCGTGVAFTRSPATGEKGIYGEYLINAQGEDVVAGIRTPLSITSTDGDGMGERFGAAFEALQGICDALEEHYREMLDVEFTIEKGRLYMLQTRTGKRTGPAAVRIAAEMVDQGLIDAQEALRRVEPQHLEQMLAPIFDTEQKNAAIAEGRWLARGLPAGPGAASGRIALTAERAEEMARAPGPEGDVLLVREETSPEDIVGMYASVGILTARGGMTSHAAVVARGLGKPCIVGAAALTIDSAAGEMRVAKTILREGDLLSIDGSTGEVITGGLASHQSEVLQAMQDGGGASSPGLTAFRKILAWADEERRLRVRANADTPQDARQARLFGAQGIGLCRTEHMFFDDDRIPLVRRMILARDSGERGEALARLLPMQQRDFEGIFEEMDGLPVTIRLLDPPLHEFLPHGEKALEQMAREMEIEVSEVAAAASVLEEMNPMLGHRGCRLGVTTPEIYDMQTEAITRAACLRQKAGGEVKAEIMVPLVGMEPELSKIRERIETIVARVQGEEGVELDLLIGTMIEVPRAALIADRIARHADFFSFGTNDLTQMTFGFSRDDVAGFLPTYVEDGYLPFDPFASLDQEGVGRLVKMACEKGRAEKEHLHLGICGEHGGDPDSVEFFHQAGLDYVSCSPFRIPIARLAAARAALREKDEID